MPPASSAAPLLLCSCIFISSASADGPPWNSVTQEVFRDTVRVRLSDEQRSHLERTGEVDLSKPQLALIRKFYPKAVKMQFPHIATAGDNMEADEEPYLIWTGVNELSVTLLAEFLKEGKKQALALTREGPIYTPAHPVARITVSGRIYVDGKRIELPELLKLFQKKSVGCYSVAPPPHQGTEDYRADDTPVEENGGDWENRRKAVLSALRELIQREKLECFQEF